MQAVLVHPERCAYLPDNVKVVQGKEATRAGILDGLSWLRRKLAEDKSDNETVVEYDTGHGLRDITGKDPAPQLRPHDACQDSLRLSALRAEDFAAGGPGAQPERLLVLLDCCLAGAMGAKGQSSGIEGLRRLRYPPGLFMPGAKGISPDEGSKGLEGLARGSGRAVLSSSQGDQLSWIRKDRTMSIFTYHLIEALTGHAQPQEGANEVLVSDVMSYVWRKVPASAKAQWKATQEPDYQVSGNYPGPAARRQRASKGQPAPDPRAALASPGPQTIQGDLVHGDKVGGDKITVGNISDSVVAIGRNSSAQSTAKG